MTFREETEAAKKDLHDLIERLKKLSEQPEAKKYSVKMDDDFIESASVFLAAFVPRAEFLHKRLIRLLDVIPKTGRRRKSL